MKRTILSLTGIAILAVILVLLNSLSRIIFSGWYMDLTDEGLYSLSPGTKNVLTKLEEPITLRYYYSKTEGKKYPAIKLYGERIEDLLREYDRVGGDRLVLEVHDPRPDSEEEEWAQKYGLSPLSGMAGEKLFLGLAAVNSLGEEKTIPLFNIARQDYLEYDVTKLVYKLSFAKKPVVGIVSSLDVAGTKTQAPPNQFGRPPQQGPWFFIEHMRDLADVRFLEGGPKRA